MLARNRTESTSADLRSELPLSLLEADWADDPTHGVMTESISSCPSTCRRTVTRLSARRQPAAPAGGFYAFFPPAGFLPPPVGRRGGGGGV